MTDRIGCLNPSICFRGVQTHSPVLLSGPPHIARTANPAQPEGPTDGWAGTRSQKRACS